MEGSTKEERDFFEILLNLELYCKESVAELNTLVAQRNESIFNHVKLNSLLINDEVRQKILQTAIIQKKIDVFHAILNYTEFVLHRKTELSYLIQTSLNTLLWLLKQLKKSQFYQEILSSFKTLAKSFPPGFHWQEPDDQKNELKELFVLKFDSEFVQNYVLKLQQLYEYSKSDGFVGPFEVAVTNDNHHHVVPKQEQEDIIEIPTHQKISTIKGIDKANLKGYKKIEAVLKATGTTFTDPEFPPHLSCIAINQNEIPPIAQTIQWKRLAEVYKQKKLTLCSDKIGPHDVNQGKLKNCYFLSALSVLAEKRLFVQRLFETKEVTPTGCYSVWICDSGEWKNIIIDDYIPCITKKNQLIPYFSRIKGNDIWVSLLEKVYAKLYGHYFTVHSGYIAEALPALTGAPVLSLKYKSKCHQNFTEQLWSFITQNLEKGSLICANCHDNPLINAKELGLITNHAYAIFDAKIVQVSEQATERIVKLRNPWGHFEWKGEWSDRQPCWTPELMKQLNYKPNRKDGIFWMKLEDVSKYFLHVFACQLRIDYGFSFLKLGGEKKQNHFVVKMKLTEPGFVYIGVQQKVKRHFRFRQDEYRYSYVRLILAKTKKGKLTSVIRGKYDIAQGLFLGRDLKKGSYLVFIEVEWAQNVYHAINITSYSSIKVHFKEEPIVNFNIQDLYKNLILAYLHGKVRSSKVKVCQYEESKEIYISKVRKFGLEIISYQNKEKYLDFHSRINLIQLSDGVEPLLPQEETFEEINVLGGSEEIILWKIKKNPETREESCFQYDEDYSVSISSNCNLAELCRNSGSLIKSFQDDLAQVFCYQYLDSLLIYYVNKSNTEGILHDELYFNQNLLINGRRSQEQIVNVGPGEEFLVKVQADGKTVDFWYPAENSNLKMIFKEEEEEGKNTPLLEINM